MKTSNLLKKTGAFCCAALMSLSCFSQAHVTMSLKNITATSNTIEYDLYIMNDGTTDLKLSACSYGVNFNDAILNGGTLSFSYVNDTKEDALSQLSSYAIAHTKTTDTRQVRMTSSPVRFDKASDLKMNTPFKVGRFKMTNSVSWTPNTKPDFYFQEVGRPGLTTTQLVGYIGNGTQLTALTPTLHTVRTEVEDNPVLNATEATAAQHAQQDLSVISRNVVATNELSIYPNPVMSALTATVSLEQAGRIRMRIVDRNGKLVKQIQADANEGFNKIRIDVSELAAGVYTLNVIDQHTFHAITHFVKQ